MAGHLRQLLQAIPQQVTEPIAARYPMLAQADLQQLLVQ